MLDSNEKKYDNILVLCLPKCGTTNLLNIFNNCDNFNCELYEPIFSEIELRTNFKNCFIKNPQLIYENIDEIKKIVEFYKKIDEDTNNDDNNTEVKGTIFIICIRDYNEALLSLYYHRRNEHYYNTNERSFMSYDEFQNLEYYDKTYLEKILEVENNILNLIDCLQNTNIKLSIIFHDDLYKYNEIEILNNLGIDVIYPNYNKDIFTSKTYEFVNEYLPNFNILDKKYKDLLCNETIQRHIYRHYIN